MSNPDATPPAVEVDEELSAAIVAYYWRGRQRGGAIQYRFLDIEGKVMSTAELKLLKLLIDPRS